MWGQIDGVRQMTLATHAHGTCDVGHQNGPPKVIEGLAKVVISGDFKCTDNNLRCDMSVIK